MNASKLGQCRWIALVVALLVSCGGQAESDGGGSGPTELPGPEKRNDFKGFTAPPEDAVSCEELGGTCHSKDLAPEGIWAPRAQCADDQGSTCTLDLPSVQVCTPNSSDFLVFGSNSAYVMKPDASCNELEVPWPRVDVVYANAAVRDLVYAASLTIQSNPDVNGAPTVGAWVSYSGEDISDPGAQVSRRVRVDCVAAALPIGNALQQRCTPGE